MLFPPAGVMVVLYANDVLTLANVLQIGWLTLGAFVAVLSPPRPYIVVLAIPSVLIFVFSIVFLVAFVFRAAWGPRILAVLATLWALSVSASTILLPLLTLSGSIPVVTSLGMVPTLPGPLSSRSALPDSCAMATSYGHGFAPGRGHPRMIDRDPACAGADVCRFRLRRGLVGLGALVAATLCPVGPMLADGTSHGPPQRRSYVGLWGFFTTCRASNDLMTSYRRRTAEFPHETIIRQATGCRVLSRQGEPPRWELELSCRVWSGDEPPPVIRVRQVIIMRSDGRTLDIDSLNRTTGETRRIDVFYCRQHHEPELMPLGILDDSD